MMEKRNVAEPGRTPCECGCGKKAVKVAEDGKMVCKKAAKEDTVTKLVKKAQETLK